MKKKIFFLISISIMVFIMATNVMAYELSINGEESSQNNYQTESLTIGFGDDKKNVTVHLIPQKEKIKFIDVENLPNTGVMVNMIRYREDIIAGIETNYYEYTLEDFPIADYENDKYYDLYNLLKSQDFISNKELNENYWAIFVHSFNTGDDYDYDYDNLNIYYFKFVDVPLLESEKVDEPETPIATDSNANPDISHGSSGSSSSGGSSRSSSKKVTNSNPNNTTGTWIQDQNGWWIKKTDGSYPKNEWVMVNNLWYHFNENGYMQTGWYTDINGKIYLLDFNSGAMYQGWWLINSNWYYFDSNGVLLVNAITPDGFQVDSNGVWIQ